MQLVYGSYTHDLGECSLQISKEPIFGDDDIPYALRERWNVAGQLQITPSGSVATDQAAITTKIGELQAAYAVQNVTAKLLTPAGADTAHKMEVGSGTVNGARCVQQPSFPVGDGAQYTTFRNFTLAIECERILLAADAILEWEESIIRIGNGGARFVVLETRLGIPQAQQVSQLTPVRLIQTGRAVGLLDYPIPPDPLWPDFCHAESIEHTARSPRTVQGKNRGYEITWGYQMTGQFVLTGNPNIRPGSSALTL